MFQSGDAVVYVGNPERDHTLPQGTIGVVQLEADDGTVLVRWPDGTTDGDGLRWHYTEDLLPKTFAHEIETNKCLDSFFHEYEVV